VTSDAVIGEFGYHPVVDDLSYVLKRSNFDRAVVIGEPITTLIVDVPSVRVAGESTLPEGLYWFVGIDSPLILQVGNGARPGGAEQLELAVGALPDHPLVDAYSWGEQLWSESKPVPAPKFARDDIALTVPEGRDIEVRDRRFLGHGWSYQVRGDGALNWVPESKLTLAQISAEPADWVIGERSPVARFGATLTRAKLSGMFADTLYSFKATRTTFRPYQFKPVLKLLQTGSARLLIADEVGLGKTIEAGLIWTELEARHEADRVLVVCPSTLVNKWQYEMEERFDLTLTVLDRKGLDAFLERFRAGHLPRRFSFVCSLETLRTWRGLDELDDEQSPPEFDLVIVDEAHQMRNTGTKSHHLGERLSSWSIDGNVVFLTATPINIRQEDLLHLLGLLEPADYQAIEDLELRIQPNAVLNAVGARLTDRTSTIDDYRTVLSRLDREVLGRSITSRAEYTELVDVLERAPLSANDIVRARRWLAELSPLGSTVTRTRKAEVDEKRPVRDASAVPIVWTDAESHFYREYMLWCQARAAVSGTPVGFSMQMPIRLASTSVHVAAREVLSGLPDEGGDDDVPTSRLVAPHPELLQAAHALASVADSKVDVLKATLSDLRGQQKQALVFTWSRATLTELETLFRETFRVAVLHGGVKKEDRRQIMADFRAGNYDFVFANKVASEGLDFEFCSAVINFDLPWNPMEIEQRIGRIDRIGQREDKILVLNFVNEEAIDSKMMAKVLDRIGIFEASIGALEPIIGANMRLIQEAMDFSLTDAERDEKFQQFEVAIATQKAGLEDLAEASTGLLIANDVPVAGLGEELTRTGRYVGAPELAYLLDDWAKTLKADGIRWHDHRRSIEFRGNAAMADGVASLAQTGRRTRNEVEALASSLRQELSVYFALDPERAQESGSAILTSTNPLVVAAVGVPGHRLARFATARIPRTDDVASGRYLAVVTHAKNASRGGDELWGMAVDDTGRLVGEEPANALLAALAAGRIEEWQSQLPSGLPRLARRATDALLRRQQEEQERRDQQDLILAESRRRVLTEQHERRVAGIQRRLQTLTDNDRSERVVRMNRGQQRRADERFAALMAEVEGGIGVVIRLEHLAACWVEVTDEHL
jgi:superfamily II DNA or RNA helicase